VFTFDLRTTVVFGDGVAGQCGEAVRRAGGRRVLVVTDPGVLAAGVPGPVLESLGADGLPYRMFSEVEPNPTVVDVERAVQAARDFGADAVVGVGGGSAMDVAKAVGILLGNPGGIADYDGMNKVPRPGAPVVCLPTTAGTAAEVTIFANYSDRERDYKFSVGGRYVAARVALVDPLLTLGLPPAVTAATGTDAFTHALESYVARSANPVSELLAFRALALIVGHLERAVADGGDLEARRQMLLGSLMAGMAFIHTRLGVVHALAMPIGGIAPRVAHGVICGVLLPPVVAYNGPAAVERYAAVADLFGLEGSATARTARLAEAIREWLGRIGIPARLADIGIERSRFAAVADQAMASGNIPVNPRAADRADLVAILEAVA
jgi:alcohol dehydrogenase class IV